MGILINLIASNSSYRQRVNQHAGIYPMILLDLPPEIITYLLSFCCYDGLPNPSYLKLRTVCRLFSKLAPLNVFRLIIEPNAPSDLIDPYWEDETWEDSPWLQKGFEIYPCLRKLKLTMPMYLLNSLPLTLKSLTLDCVPISLPIYSALSQLGDTLESLTLQECPGLQHIPPMPNLKSLFCTYDQAFGIDSHQNSPKLSHKLQNLECGAVSELTISGKELPRNLSSLSLYVYDCTKEIHWNAEELPPKLSTLTLSGSISVHLKQITSLQSLTLYSMKPGKDLSTLQPTCLTVFEVSCSNYAHALPYVTELEIGYENYVEDLVEIPLPHLETLILHPNAMDMDFPKMCHLNMEIYPNLQHFETYDCKGLNYAKVSKPTNLRSLSVRTEREAWYLIRISPKLEWIEIQECGLTTASRVLLSSIDGSTQELFVETSELYRMCKERNIELRVLPILTLSY